MAKRVFFIGVVLFAVVPAALYMSAATDKFTLAEHLQVAAILAAVSAATWTMGFGAFIVARNSRKVRTVAFLPGEQLEHSAPANRMTGFVTHGGQLFFTNQRIVFQPHGINFNVDPVIIPWTDVVSLSLGTSAELGLLRLAAGFAAGVAQSGNGVLVYQQVTPRSEVLFVKHGGADSRFVVATEPTLLQVMASVSGRFPWVKQA